AGLFGARRQPGSGSGGRDDQTASDSTHPGLFIESKLRATCAVRSLYEAIRPRAKAEGKIPVLALSSKRRPGTLLVVHSSDLPARLAVFAGAGAEPADPPPVE